MVLIPLNAEGKQVHGKGAEWQFSGDVLEKALDDATRLTLHDQENAGIEIVSDGEQRRKSYLTHITSQLEGFDYQTLTKKWTRNNRRPTIISSPFFCQCLIVKPLQLGCNMSKV